MPRKMSVNKVTCVHAALVMALKSMIEILICPTWAPIIGHTLFNIMEDQNQELCCKQLGRLLPRIVNDMVPVQTFLYWILASISVSASSDASCM